MSLVDDSETTHVGVSDPRVAVDEALGSLRVDGLEPCALGLALLEDVADGRLSHQDAIARMLAHYRR